MFVTTENQEPPESYPQYAPNVTSAPFLPFFSGKAEKKGPPEARRKRPRRNESPRYARSLLSSESVSSFPKHKRFAGLLRKGMKERWGMCPDKMLELIFAATCAWQKFLDPSRPGRRRQFTNWRGEIYCAAVSSFAALRMRRALYGQRGDAVPHFKKTWRL